MPQIDIRLVSSADPSGFARINAGLDQLESNLRKKLSFPDIGKSILTGFGLGSGFAIAQTFADKIVDSYREAADFAVKIEQASQRELDAVRAIIRLRQSPQQQVDTLAKQVADAQAQYEASTQQKYRRSFNTDAPNILDQFKIVENKRLPRADTPEEQARSAELLAQWKELSAKLAQAQRPFEDAKVNNSLLGFFGDLDDASKRSAENLKAENESIASNVRNYLSTVLKPALDAEHKLLEVRQQATVERRRNAFTAQEQEFSRKIAEFDQKRADIQNNNLLTEQEKSAKLLPLIEDQNQLIADRIALLEREQRLTGDPNSRLQLQDQIDRLRGQSARNSGEATNIRQPDTLSIQGQKGMRDLGDPSKHYQSGRDGILGSLQGQIAQVGTWGDQLARAFDGIGNSIRMSLGGALTDMMTTTGSFRDKVINFTGAIGMAFIQTGAQMVADWIYQHTVMAAVKSLFKQKEVAEHAAAEGEKAAISAAGATTQVGIATAEAGGITAVTGPAAILRSIMELGPIAGPVVMGLSLVGMLALIASLAQGFETGGFPQGKNALIRVNENGQEAVLNAAATRNLGHGMISRLNAGMDLNVAASLTRPAIAPSSFQSGAFGAGGAQDVTIIDGSRPREVERVIRDPRLDRKIVRVMDKNRRRMGVRL